ncbi:hypothetical protein U1Q18_042838, partial [Sarracenia purpurea var. burkii]
MAAAVPSTPQGSNRTLQELIASNCFNLTHICSYGVNYKIWCSENLLVPFVVSMTPFGLFVEKPDPVEMLKFRVYTVAHLHARKLRCAAG